MRPAQSFRYNGSVLFRFCSNASALHFCVTKKYGNAVERNLFKRRARSLFKEFSKPGDPFYNYTIYMTPLKKNISFSTIHRAFLNLQAQLLKQ
ncbi:hypothetical protein CL659_06220 [bacterium]|nr:hypothetical protein [bacterium]|tara:strand:- start:194 stop:472 length:279 start_codon:yes stop_codon:yes gene_type:complete